MANFESRFRGREEDPFNTERLGLSQIFVENDLDQNELEAFGLKKAEEIWEKVNRVVTPLDE